MKSLTTRISSALVFATFSAQSAFASVDSGAAAAKPDGTPSSLFGDGSAFQLISNTLIYLVGAIAVIMIIIGGLRYVISQGSSENVKQAKDTILYGIIGLVVAILAYAIVHFVASSLHAS